MGYKMNFEAKYVEGMRIGPYPDGSYILINPGGSLFIQNDTKWTPLKSSGDWLEKESASCEGKPTNNYRTFKYRRMGDFEIGYMGVKTIRLYAMWSNQEIFINIALNDGTELSYNRGKYSQ